MKVKGNRKQLLEAMTLAQTIVPVKPVQPILNNVKLTAADNQVEILATDWEVSLRYKADMVEVMEDGTAILPARQFADILRKLPDESVTFAVEDRILTLSKEHDYFKVQGDDPEEFPEVPSFREEGVFEVDPATFSDMLKKTMFAAAKEKMRYALNGVFFSVEGNSFTMVATDGKRLAKIKRRIKGKKGLKVDAIVPTKGVALLEKLVAAETEPVKISMTETLCMAQTKNATLASRLVEGQFPKYEDVIPKEMTKKIELPRATFLALVDQASTFTSTESMAVKLSLLENKLVLSSQAPDLGEAKVAMTVEYSGEPLEMGFNPAYLKEVLSVMSKEKFTFELKERTSPGIISDDDDYLYVVMPVNIL
jgi:DNA polymerase-3 subunit beta